MLFYCREVFRRRSPAAAVRAAAAVQQLAASQQQPAASQQQPAAASNSQQQAGAGSSQQQAGAAGSSRQQAAGFLFVGDFRRDVPASGNAYFGLRSSFRAMVFPRPAAPIFCSVSRVSEATLDIFWVRFSD